MEEGGGTFYDYGYGTYNPATGYFDPTPEFQAEQVRLEQELQNRQGTASRPATAAEQAAYAGYGGGGGGEMGAGDTNFSQEYIDYLIEQANRSSTTDTSAADAAAAAEAAAAAAASLAEFNERFSGGLLSPEEIQNLIDQGMTEDQVLTLIGNYQLNENQLGQLYTQGLLTEEQIAQIIGQVEAGNSTKVK